MEQRSPSPRGRHAPPPEVRLPLQRQRLVRAAAQVFAEQGFLATSSDAISRRAGMSKATFYQHFDNKEECMIAVFDRATEVLQQAIAAGVQNVAADKPAERARSAAHAYLTVIEQFPEYIQTIVVESYAAGPAVSCRRDRILQDFAELLDGRNAAAAELGQVARYVSPHQAYAIVGAIAELLARWARLGVPRDIHELEPVIERLIVGTPTPAA
jgi:AcrR family transcriptional regulator